MSTFSAAERQLYLCRCLCLSADFCRDLYLELVKTANGKVAWSFLKPLLLGKIPFAPDTPVTRAIMNEVGIISILWLNILGRI